MPSSHKPPTPAQLQKQVRNWNAKHTRGTPVRYLKVKPADRPEDIVETLTTSEAFVLGGHTAVVMLKGVSSAALDHCTALT